MDALETIRQDLRELGRRRRVAFVAFLALLAVLLGVFFLQTPKPTSLPRDAGWALALTLLVAGTVLGASVTLGYPLMSRPAVYAATGGIGIAALAALWLTVDPAAPGPEAVLKAGVPCFVFGTAIGAVAMLGLGVLSGRLWRRFPNPGLALALGMTGVGLAALHMRCGGVDPLHLFGFHLSPLLVICGLAHLAVRTKNELSQE